MLLESEKDVCKVVEWHEAFNSQNEKDAFLRALNVACVEEGMLPLTTPKVEAFHKSFVLMSEKGNPIGHAACKVVGESMVTFAMPTCRRSYEVKMAVVGAVGLLSHRGQGLSKLLIARATTSAARSGADIIVARSGNPVCIGSFMSLGYRKAQPAARVGKTDLWMPAAQWQL